MRSVELYTVTMWFVALLLASSVHAHYIDREHPFEGSEKDMCVHRYYAPATFPWVKDVHIVSMTHLDIGGWGPDSDAPPGSRAEDDCVNDCKYAGDICDSYTGSAGQAKGGYLAAALTTSNELKQSTNYTPPSGTTFPTCFPGHARSHSRTDADCVGYKPNWSSEDCEKAGCCTDHSLYHNTTSVRGGWFVDGLWMGCGWFVDGLWIVCGWITEGWGWFVDGLWRVGRSSLLGS